MGKEVCDGLEKYINRFDVETIHQDGKRYLKLYKLVRCDYGSWWFGGSSPAPYRPGTLVRVVHWDCSRHYACAEGLHVLPHISNVRRFASSNNGIPGDYRVVSVAVEDVDVVAVPYTGDKIRCKKLQVLEEVGL